MHQKKTFKYQLSEGDLFTLPYPTISNLSYIFLGQTDNLIELVYSWCSDDQKQLFENDFMLLSELTTSVLNFHYQVITDKPRLEPFFERALRIEEEGLKDITDPTELKERQNSIKQRKRNISPEPKALMKAVLNYSQQSDTAVNYNSWLRNVGEHLNLSSIDTACLDYDIFIEASNALTIQNDIRTCQEIELEQERKQQEARQ